MSSAGAAGAPGLDRVDVVQPVLWAVMVSLAELWRSLGVIPDAVIGHSQGEIAAAYVAGGLSLEDAARVVALRSRLLVQLSGAGAWCRWRVGCPRPRNWWRSGVIGSISLRSTVFQRWSSPARSTPSRSWSRRCEAEDVRARRIDVDYASHSAQVDAIREPLIEALAGIEPHSSSVAFFSTVTGELMDTAGLDADYWYQSIRQPCSSNRRSAARATPGIGCSSNPARIRC